MKVAGWEMSTGLAGLGPHPQSSFADCPRSACRTEGWHANRQASRPFVGATIRSEKWRNLCDTC